MTTYYSIVFHNDYDDAETRFFLENTTRDTDSCDSIIGHLAQWDFGSESEHTPQAAPSHGTADETYETADYILSWNTGLGYVGLDRKDEA